ncbi:alpha-L-fucosidase [Rubellicoccus peritrichatus]|uniref:alpha-L-fucosidase n=1 Tax=Rubellicoccus peritrichatus TaxID=3080537 RepID=A0AAQ3QUA4_9BACT|nr:alpha-L-fucosidase [Puniceicoccus sp. CR14]WOO40263.1 alpha-L-fucosidase [Puniceicoccus sp. CR14]
MDSTVLPPQKPSKTVKRFEPTWESLQQYKCPDWFRDAKFGIWAHWGPQGVPMVGDWYARNMYVQGNPMYEHHCRVYGHPSKFGYKDLVKLWKAENFDPEKIVDLYKRVGAKYFVSCGAHHDNFDCWNSKHHSWNSVNVGPGKDIVGMFAKAARGAGLKFGVTDHLERAWSWFNTNKGADRTGPYAGVPYDGNDPKYADFYFEPHAETSSAYPQTAPESWMRHWQARMFDLIDQYDPDLFYTDGAVPFGEIGLEVMAELYNRNIERRGSLEAVYALKDHEHLKHYGNHGEYREGIGVLDVERGVTDGIQANPWQTDTCVGEWYYQAQCTYKSPAEIITMLIDIVSKNGNLLLNFPVKPDGTLDEEEIWIAEEIGKWMSMNSEGIYGTRPWERFGEGPTRLEAGLFAEREKKAFTAEDIRFTRKGDVLYAFFLGWPTDGIVKLKSLNTDNAPKVVRSVELVGHGEIGFSRTGRHEEGVLVTLPNERPCDYAWLLKIQM